MRRCKSFPALLPLWFGTSSMLFCATALATDADDQSTSMLVREWNADNGEVIGWLPLHSAAIRLSVVDGPLPLFEPNQAVQIEWPTRPKLSPQTRQVLVSPEPRVFEGERWVPAKSDINVVRIAKRLFLIRSIIFGASKWRLALPRGGKKPKD